tara:strand:- start:6128 stop:6475 length:348 start_codon:yes stop_codon:yes gene_type:complete
MEFGVVESVVTCVALNLALIIQIVLLAIIDHATPLSVYGSVSDGILALTVAMQIAAVVCGASATVAPPPWLNFATVAIAAASTVPEIISFKIAITFAILLSYPVAELFRPPPAPI